MENNYLSTNVALTSQKIDTNSSKYYRNSKEILNDEQKPISEGDFKNIIKHEIFNFIGHFENIILIWKTFYHKCKRFLDLYPIQKKINSISHTIKLLKLLRIKHLTITMNNTLNMQN